MPTHTMTAARELENAYLGGRRGYLGGRRQSDATTRGYLGGRKR